MGATPQSLQTLREPVLDRVFLAGEAISDQPGTIRGAIDSGATAARQVLEVAGDDERVAVVGAGAAGAEAARQLAMRGLDVVVIEARDRTGGRIDSRRTEAEGTVELGAWRLADAADAEFIGRLERAGVGVVPLVGTSAYGADATVTEVDGDLEVVAAGIAESVDAAAELPSDVSVAEAIEVDGLAADLSAEDALLLQRVLAEFAATTGADAGELSSWYLSRPIGEAVSVADGPMSAVIDNALEEREVALSTAVVAVFYDEERVSLRLGTGESLAVDRVILTVPLGVLKEQAIEFDPSLPLLHRSALDDLTVGHAEVVALEFAEPFWSTEAVVWLNDDADAAVRLWVNLHPLTGQYLLVGLVGGAAAAELTELNDDELLVAAQRSLAVFA